MILVNVHKHTLNFFLGVNKHTYKFLLLTYDLGKIIFTIYCILYIDIYTDDLKK